MRGLSVRQPWVWAILFAGKRVENREWDPGSGNATQARRIIEAGGEFMLHASAGCTRDEYEDACYSIDVTVFRQDVVPPLKTLTRGALVARARLVGVVETHAMTGHRFASFHCSLCGAAWGTGRGTDACPKADPWAIPGCLGLILDDVRPLAEPVPFKGALGFFDVPAVGA